LLADLLRAVGEAAAVVAERVDCSVTVVDDDPAGSAAEIVASAPISIPVRYVPLGARSISAARNALVEAAVVEADLLAMIDDDCRPGSRWLATLLDVAEDTAADMVSGTVEYRAEPGGPPWLADEGFLGVTVRYRDREEPAFGCTANSLFRSAWLRAHPEVRFEERFGRLGGEDMTFFAAAKRTGARLRWSAGATVVERVPPERCTLRYMVVKNFWYGNNQVVLHLHNRDYGRVRLALQAGRRALEVVASGVAGIVPGRRVRPRRTLCDLAFCAGKGLGVAGLRVAHR
jgi:hypothetical protein